MQTILDFFREDNKALSNMRLNTTIIVIVVCFLLGWIVIIQKANITEALVGLAIAVMGIKAGQKYIENKNETDNGVQ